jgi:hypothetical protein
VTLQEPAGADEQAHFARRSTRSREAYQHYLQGLHDWRALSGDSALQSRKHFEQAIALDPDYALPYVGIGWTYQVLVDWVLPPREAETKAREAAQKALDLDPSLA